MTCSSRLTWSLMSIIIMACKLFKLIFHLFFLFIVRILIIYIRLIWTNFVWPVLTKFLVFFQFYSSRFDQLQIYLLIKNVSQFTPSIPSLKLLNPIIRKSFNQRLRGGGGGPECSDSVKSITGREILCKNFKFLYLFYVLKRKSLGKVKKNWRIILTPRGPKQAVNIIRALFAPPLRVWYG